MELISHFTAAEWSAMLSALLAFVTAVVNVKVGNNNQKTVDAAAKTVDRSIDLATGVSKDLSRSLRTTTKALTDNLSSIGNRTAEMNVKLDSLKSRLEQDK